MCNAVRNSGVDCWFMSICRLESQPTAAALSGDLQNVVDTGSPCIAVIASTVVVKTSNQTNREREGREEAHREVELTLLFVAKASRIYTIRAPSSILMTFTVM